MAFAQKLRVIFVCQIRAAFLHDVLDKSQGLFESLLIGGLLDLMRWIGSTVPGAVDQR